jgi:hypothetical protein
VAGTENFMTKSKAKNRKRGRQLRVQRVVSRRHRVSEYINPKDPDGQRLVMPGLVDDDSLKIAADHFGCRKSRIKTRSKMVTDDYLNALPEYDG